MFVDILPFPYYDMLIVNAFMEFGDLMYTVGRIEDGIKRGKIVDTRASMREKKRIVPDEYVQAMSREERESKRRSHMTREEPVKSHPRSPGYAQVPLVGLHSPKRFAQEYDQASDSGYYQSKKRKRTKVYHTLPMSCEELLPMLVQNHGISIILARPKGPPYLKKYDVNAKCEYHGGVGGGTPWRIIRLSRTRFNR